MKTEFRPYNPLIKTATGIAWLLACLLPWSSPGQLTISGRGRMVFQKQELSGSLLTGDSLSDRLTSGGYMLADLNTAYSPLKWLKFSMENRVKNRTGGFGGIGLEVLTREIRLDVMAGKYLQLTAGDIDLKGSNTTLRNYSELPFSAESQIFRFRRAITEYENFYLDGHWRIRGLLASAGNSRQFRKNEWSVKAFAATNRDRNIWKSGLPLHSGILGAIRNENHYEFLAEGIHFQENTSELKSRVALISLDGTLKKVFPKWEIGAGGRGAQSEGIRKSENTVTTKDFLWQAHTYLKINKINSRLALRYSRNGAFFESPGSQTLRITGNARPDIFAWVGNGGMQRQALMLDRTGTETIQNQALSLYRQVYLPQYEWVLPYGEASPNRQGTHLNWTMEEWYGLSLTAGAKFLKEILGEGIKDKREFTEWAIRLNGDLSQCRKEGKKLSINGMYRQQNSRRAGDLPTRFQVRHLDLGLNWECAKRVDIHLGMKQIWAEGNEVLTRFNTMNRISSYEPFVMNQTENLLGAGINLRITDRCFWLISGYFSKLKRKDHSADYEINQFFTTFQYDF